MDYIPNASARSLITQKSYTIGIIFDEITGVGLQHPLFSKVLESFKNVAEQSGYDIMYATFGLEQFVSVSTNLRAWGTAISFFSRTRLFTIAGPLQHHRLELRDPVFYRSEADEDDGSIGIPGAE